MKEEKEATLDFDDEAGAAGGCDDAVVGRTDEMRISERASERETAACSFLDPSQPSGRPSARSPVSMTLHAVSECMMA